ncbi:hypothetical protein NPIL_201791, partial [Nephila pilipes]
AISKENLNACELELKLHLLHTIENSLRHLLRLQIEHRHQKSTTAQRRLEHRHQKSTTAQRRLEHRHQKSTTAQRRLEHRPQEPSMTGTPESTVSTNPS